MGKLQKAFDNFINEYYWLHKSVSKQGYWDDELKAISKALDKLEAEIKKVENRE